jgi:hypothetical protein
MAKYAHGTYSAYVACHCRCAKCRAAAAAYNRAYRARPVEEKKLTHGKISSYNAGCRCAKCRATKKIANQGRKRGQT